MVELPVFVTLTTPMLKMFKDRDAITEELLINIHHGHVQYTYIIELAEDAVHLIASY